MRKARPTRQNHLNWLQITNKIYLPNFYFLLSVLATSREFISPFFNYSFCQCYIMFRFYRNQLEISVFPPHSDPQKFLLNRLRANFAPTTRTTKKHKWLPGIFFNCASPRPSSYSCKNTFIRNFGIPCGATPKRHSTPGAKQRHCRQTEKREEEEKFIKFDHCH